MKSRTKSNSKKSPLDKLLQQLTECLTTESAKRLIKLRADAESQKQIDEWPTSARKAL